MAGRRADRCDPPNGGAASGETASALIRRCFPALLACTLFLILAAPAGADGRVALVIGNADYDLRSLALANPGNDARAVAEKLRSLDFDVRLHTDLEREAMKAAAEDFSVAAAGADMAVVFFAGHGIQKDGENHLLGTEFSELSLAALSESALALSEVQDALVRAAPKIGIVIIDACRNNPFAEQGIVAPGLARASGGARLLFAYSTDPGNVAYDGEGSNSQFTSALLRHIDAPGLDVRLMFGRVRQNVILETHGDQIPWVEESVIGEHSFSTVPPQPPSSAVAREIERWREVSRLSGVEPYRQFLAEFPNGMFHEFAEQRISNPQAPQPAADLQEMDRGSRLATVTALAVLGFLPPEASDVPPDDATLGRALQAYAAQTGNEGASFDPGRLYMDAARTLALLGAKTAQQLRTDMAMLSAIESAAHMAEDALTELQGLAKTNPDARPILAQAVEDVNAIHVRRQKVHEQLDAGREYYSDLLALAQGEFRPMIRSVAARITKNGRAADQDGDQHASDLALFVNHVVRQQDDATEGSYAWMIDFLPE
jgi:hypothetical protein